jgi:MYXO-CTERM domain-containing protein
MSFTRLLVAAGALAVMLTAAPLAQAQDCKTTAECPQGFVCELAPAPPPEPAPACPPGALCPVTDPAPTTKIAAVAGFCRPAPCTKDSECGPTQVCHTETIASCSGGGSTGVACAPNTKCDPPAPVPPPVCTETKVSVCAFKWQLPCSADTDCGAGFNCMPSVTGTCSSGTGTATPGTTGSGSAGTSGTAAPGTAAAAPAVAVPVPPGNCTTTTSFPGYCQPKATMCTVNTDCPADWMCVAAPTPVTSDPARPTSGGTGGTAGATGGAVPPSTTPVPPAPGPAPVPADTHVCQSPYGYGIGQGSSTPSDPKGGGAGGTTGTSTGGGTAGTTSGGTPPRAEDTSSPKAGCAIATGAPGAGAPLMLGSLALLGLALARRRRHR